MDGAAMQKASTAALRRHMDRLVEGAFGAQATDRDLLQRFSGQHEQAAFEVLFRRHAPMVLAVARRVLGSPHDAEDVCQAAFLVLAQKAGGQRWQSSVAGWLHKTAHQLALKLRTSAQRRTRREGSAVPPRSANPLAEISAQELLAILDEELLMLAERVREPLVLCYLQGATRDEAARRLGCPLATLKKRLERGRELLHAALGRRGLGLSAVLLGTLLSQQTAAAALLARQTAEAAATLAAGKPVAGIVSARVVELL